MCLTLLGQWETTKGWNSRERFSLLSLLLTGTASSLYILSICHQAFKGRAYFYPVVIILSWINTLPCIIALRHFPWHFVVCGIHNWATYKVWSDLLRLLSEISPSPTEKLQLSQQKGMKHFYILTVWGAAQCCANNMFSARGKADAFLFTGRLQHFFGWEQGEETGHLLEWSCNPCITLG